MDSLVRASSTSAAGSVTAAAGGGVRPKCLAGGRPRLPTPAPGHCYIGAVATPGPALTQQLTGATRQAQRLAASAVGGGGASAAEAHRQPPPPTQQAPLQLHTVTSINSSSSSSSSRPQTSSRRGLLLSSAAAAAAALAPWLGPEMPAAAQAAGVGALLHSRRSDAPCSLTIRNRSAAVVEARWVNYDGDEEPYATIPPGHEWTVDTFETHPWRFRNARTGGLMCEYVAARGPRLLQLTDTGAAEADAAMPNAPPAGERATRTGSGSGSGQARGGSGKSPHAMEDVYDDQQGGGEGDMPAAAALQPEEPPATGLAGGFDGLGHPQSEYTLATLLSVGILPREEQALVVLALDAYTHPLTLLVGLPEARAVVNAAAGSRSRRPSMLATWSNTLQALGGKVERVVVTRQVGGIFYARIVLSQPDAQQQQQQQQRGVGRPAAGSSSTGSGSGSSTGARRIVSVDARPSDALALALEAGVDVFVSRPVAELVQRQYEEAERDLPDRLLPPPEGDAAPPPGFALPGLGLDEAGQYAARRQLRQPGAAGAWAELREAGMSA
ncbi:hypothetical protein HYH02_003443 [Chlamydomonas schloesseri]|uniref:BFN domain-containing protein n=1 Tax=Chlamydomonas schloesseri TaxID=2026947 RepID=A0A835WPI3_9CHLO|nr:hypothetical protein HYH02_003443 [Chlamydomonas schloesseri]|eukprot:KAG2451663.1 hypothetical protein HYH02_003443 [Chlamydomonas schloesseri]